MSWTVTIEDEKGVELEIFEKEFDSQVFFSGTEKRMSVLKYLDLYGDTIFNRNQINDLIKDFDYLKTLEPCNLGLINELIYFANKVKNEPHLYLKFYGD